MIFVVQRIQKDKLAIFNINHEYKPMVIDANWEVQLRKHKNWNMNEF